ncbi:ninein-like protein isoform X3 [Lethenteron reissneri]|uniref:ninein-like protein isoform X3 n=1 Tax=Lethenteron reissneri TaxID=7753 RepID=UPI002AB5E64B|nr:ninein-like protein isoform X3 [Lethenteron reissneri]
MDEEEQRLYVERLRAEFYACCSPRSPRSPSPHGRRGDHRDDHRDGHRGDHRDDHRGEPELCSDHADRTSSRDGDGVDGRIDERAGVRSSERVDVSPPEGGADRRLGADGLWELCRRLEMQDSAPLLLQTLLGGGGGKVSFDEFKEGFVAVLSKVLTLSSSSSDEEDDTSFLEPVLETRPRMVRGGKRYGRRSVPEAALRRSPPGGTAAAAAGDTGGAAAVARAGGRAPCRSTSLDSVDSLPSEEEEEELMGERDLETETLESEGRLPSSGVDCYIRSPTRTSTPRKGCRAVTPPLSFLDDGSGLVPAARLVDFWQQEGVPDPQEVLQSLGVGGGGLVSLAELWGALEGELRASGHPAHRAALATFTQEVSHTRAHAWRVRRERAALKAELERAERNSAELAREADERLAASAAQIRRELEQERAARGRRGERWPSSGDREELEACARLQAQLQAQQHGEATLRAHIAALCKGKECLERELLDVSSRLSESQDSVQRLAQDVETLLTDKLARSDVEVGDDVLVEEERFQHLVAQYEQQCRELRDRNDELEAELESVRRAAQRQHSVHSDASEVGDRKSPETRGKTLNGTHSSPGSPSPSLPLEAEMAMERLRQRHQEEVQDLRIKLETKTNYYERELERVQRGAEELRRSVEQSFKLELSDLEEQLCQRDSDLRDGDLRHRDAWQREAARRDGLEAELRGETKTMRAQLEAATSDLSELRARTGAAQELQAQVQQESTQRQRLETELRERTKQAAELESELRERAQRVVGLEAELHEKAQQVSRLEVELRKEAQCLDRLKEELREGARQASGLEVELRDRAQKIVGLETELREKSQNVVGLEAELRDRAQQVAGLEAELHGRGEAVTGLTAEVDRLKQENEELVTERHALRTETSGLQAVKRELASLHEERNLLLEQNQAVLSRLGSLQHKALSAEGSLRSRELELARLQTELRRGAQDKEGLTAEVAALREEAAALGGEVATLRRRLRSAEEQAERCPRLEQELKILRAERDALTQDAQEARDKILELNAELCLAQSQHQRELQRVRADTQGELHGDRGGERGGDRGGADGARERAAAAAAAADSDLRAEFQKVITTQQEEHTVALRVMEQKLQEVEVNLRNVRAMLQEKVQQLKEQTVRASRSDVALRELYVENAALSRLVAHAEGRLSAAALCEHRLQERLGALHRVLRRVAPAALSAA